MGNSSTNQQPASQAFSYNKFDVTDNIRVLCRCAIDGYLISGNRGKSKDWVKIFALNQYDCNASKTVNWAKTFGTKMSTIMSQEVGNNNYKIARWAMMAHLSDAKFIKCIQELKDDGRYVAVRDPLKQVIRIYKVQDNGFVKEDGMPSFGQFKKMVN